MNKKAFEIMAPSFFLGMLLVILDLLGATLNWKTGLLLMVMAVVVSIFVAALSAVAFAIREMKRRRTE